MQSRQDKMNKNFQVIENKVMLINEMMPTKFKSITSILPVEYKIICGVPVFTKFIKHMEYIPTEYTSIKFPVHINL